MGSRTVYLGLISAICFMIYTIKRLKGAVNLSLNYRDRIPYLAIARQAYLSLITNFVYT